MHKQGLEILLLGLLYCRCFSKLMLISMFPHALLRVGFIFCLIGQLQNLSLLETLPTPSQIPDYLCGIISSSCIMSLLFQKPFGRNKSKTFAKQNYRTAWKQRGDMQRMEMQKWRKLLLLRCLNQLETCRYRCPIESLMRCVWRNRGHYSSRAPSPHVKQHHTT